MIVRKLTEGEDDGSPGTAGEPWPAAAIELETGGSITVTEEGNDDGAGSVIIQLDILGGAEAEKVILVTSGGRQYDWPGDEDGPRERQQP